MCLVIRVDAKKWTQVSLSMVSEQNVSQSISNELKFNSNGQFTKLAYTLTKNKHENSYETFEEPSCMNSIFWWFQANYYFHLQ